MSSQQQISYDTNTLHEQATTLIADLSHYRDRLQSQSSIESYDSLIAMTQEYDVSVPAPRTLVATLEHTDNMRAVATLNPLQDYLESQYEIFNEYDTTMQYESAQSLALGAETYEYMRSRVMETKQLLAGTVDNNKLPNDNTTLLAGPTLGQSSTFQYDFSPYLQGTYRFDSGISYDVIASEYRETSIQ
jgi:hypothetical protein